MGEKRDGKEVKVKAKKAKAKKAKNENGGEKKRNREIVGVDERAKSLGEKLGKGKVPKLEIELAESSETKRVSLGEPGCTPKIVHEVENLNTTPLAVREARAEEEAVAAARAAEQDKQALVKHTTSIAEMAEKRGGFTATKGGLALVGLVARSMAENPGVGVKNLYKAVCETVGCVPGKGAAPAAREVRKIMAALKDLKSLEAVMSSTKQFSNVGRRTELVMKKQKEGPKSEEGSCKLFMGNLSWAIKEDDGEEILKKFFSKCLKNGAEIKDIVKLKDAEGLFLGTGFIEFSTPEATMAALGLHGTECEGRAINLHFARARSEGSISRRSHQAPASELSSKPDGCTTVFVANLPFTIDENEVKRWANECGEVTSIRWLNDKQTGRFKGCGYIEFGAASAAEAVEKMVSRNSSELLGRAVRVDYAEGKPMVAGES